jgi:hypothetical protein
MEQYRFGARRAASFNPKDREDDDSSAGGTSSEAYYILACRRRSIRAYPPEKLLIWSSASTKLAISATNLLICLQQPD